MPIYTRVKICGITSVEDAIAVAESGADAIGLNFYDKSPRYISTRVAQDIVAAVGPFVSVVGLFVNPRKESVKEVISSVNLNILQFHGDETEGFCSQFDLPYVKALRVRAEKPDMTLGEVRTSIREAMSIYASACGILLDAYSENAYGGTGELFNWQAVPPLSRGCCDGVPLILAGGLTAENVTGAVQGVQPYAVDVSSGIEHSPGKKDFEKVNRFVRNSRIEK